MSAFVTNGPLGWPDKDAALPLTGERTIPGLAQENYWFRRHEVVYERLADRCAGRDVLEAGCGEGYGAALLGRDGVTGLDLDRPDIRLEIAVQERYRRWITPTARAQLAFDDVAVRQRGAQSGKQIPTRIKDQFDGFGWRRIGNGARHAQAGCADDSAMGKIIFREAQALHGFADSRLHNLAYDLFDRIADGFIEVVGETIEDQIQSIQLGIE